MQLINDGHSELDAIHQMESVETPVPDSLTSSTRHLLAEDSNFCAAKKDNETIDEEQEDLCESVHSEVAPIVPNPPQISISEMPTEMGSPHKSTFDRNLDDVVDINEQMMSNVVRDMAMSQDENMLKMQSLLSKVDGVERRKAVKKSTFDRQLDDVVDINERLMGNVVRDMAFSVTRKQVGTVKGHETSDTVIYHGNTASNSTEKTYRKFKSIRDRIKYFDLNGSSRNLTGSSQDLDLPPQKHPDVKSLASIAASPHKDDDSVLSGGTMKFLQNMDREGSS